MEIKCFVQHCENKCIIKDMCYKHGILRYKLTKYYHDIGDPLLIESYKKLPDENEIHNYTKEQIEKFIKKLRFIWFGWNKCLIARKELTTLCFSTLDYGHKYFIDNVIIPNMNIIENNLSLCYLLLEKYKNINNIEENNLDKIIEIKTKSKMNKKKKYKKIPKNKYKSNNKSDEEILNMNINFNFKLLSNTESFIVINREIKNINSFMKYLFTDDIYNDEKYILNNASYCVFIKDIFMQYKLKYINLSYNIKTKDISFDCECFLDKEDEVEELSKFKNFNDGLFEWYNKIINILKNIKINSNKLYKTYIKHKSDNNENYFQNIDDFIESQFKPLCIHIYEGNIKNICLENRHNRIFSKKDLHITEIFNKLEMSISSMYIPKNIQECLCFWILHEIQSIVETTDKKIMKEDKKLIEGWLYCCVNNNMFCVYGNVDVNELFSYNFEIIKKIIELGCYSYFLKYIENDNLNLDYIKKIKNNKINIFLINNDKPKIIYDNVNKDNNIMIYYMIKK